MVWRSSAVIPLRKRQHLLAAILGLGLGVVAPTALAAENIVLVSGAFRRSIPVVDLEHLAATGQARGLLATILTLGKQKPEEVRKLLNASTTLPVVLVSRLLNTRIGEAILQRVTRIIYPLKASEVGLPALRSAVVLGIDPKNSTISALSFLRAYPSDNLEVNLPALMALTSKASSISELVRFFSESPLDGLRGASEAAPPPAARPQAANPAASDSGSSAGSAPSSPAAGGQP